MLQGGSRRFERKIERDFTRGRSSARQDTFSRRGGEDESFNPNNMMVIANCRHQLALCNGLSRAKYVVRNASFGEHFFDVDRGIYLMSCKPMNSYGLSEIEFMDSHGKHRIEFVAFPNIVHLGSLKKAIRLLDKPDYMY